MAQNSTFRYIPYRNKYLYLSKYMLKDGHSSFICEAKSIYILEYSHPYEKEKTTAVCKKKD